MTGSGHVAEAPRSPRRGATVWNEFRHEKLNLEVRRLYPRGTHAVIANAVRCAAPEAQVATREFLNLRRDPLEAIGQRRQAQS